MFPHFAANAVVVFHLGFILFVICGGWLVLYHLRWAWLHAPAWAWGVWIEVSHRICPLTPLENHFRALAGEAGYSGGFIDHYLIPVIYPAGLEPTDQVSLAAALLTMNAALYAGAIVRQRRRRRASNSSGRLG